MAYLEQSTRYVPYTDKLHGRWRYHVPGGDRRTARCATRYVSTMDAAFETYAKLDPGRCRPTSRSATRAAPADSEAVHRAAIRAKALDTLRGMLPAATQSNLGIYGTGQAFEALLLRLRASPLDEVRDCADGCWSSCARSSRHSSSRVDQPDRGGRWSDYLRDTRERTAAARRDAARRRRRRTAGRGHADRLRSRRRGQDRRRGALRRRLTLPDDQLMTIARGACRRPTASRVLRAYVGERDQPPPPARPGVRAHQRTVSTSSPTTARSAICSAIGC